MIAHHGAALTHVLFLPPHAIVIEFNANVNKHFHNLCSLANRAWTMLTVDGIFTDGSYNHLIDIKFSTQRMLDLTIMINKAVDSIVKFLNKNNIMPDLPILRSPARDNIGDYQHIHDKLSNLFINQLYESDSNKIKKSKPKTTTNPSHLGFITVDTAIKKRKRYQDAEHFQKQHLGDSILSYLTFQYQVGYKKQ